MRLYDYTLGGIFSGQEFSQENQVGYDDGDGTIILIAWIKFFSHE